MWTANNGRIIPNLPPSWSAKPSPSFIFFFSIFIFFYFHIVLLMPHSQQSSCHSSTTNQRRLNTSLYSSLSLYHYSAADLTINKNLTGKKSNPHTIQPLSPTPAHNPTRPELWKSTEKFAFHRLFTVLQRYLGTFFFRWQWVTAIGMDQLQQSLLQSEFFQITTCKYFNKNSTIANRKERKYHICHFFLILFFTFSYIFSDYYNFNRITFIIQKKFKHQA